MSDWYDDGVKLIKEEVVTRTGVSFTDVERVYHVLSDLGLIDYDLEKDVIEEWGE